MKLDKSLKNTVIRLSALAALVVAGGLPASTASAIDWKGRWYVSARIADYFPADEQGGGFRRAQGDPTARAVSENDVKLGETFYPSFTIGRGILRRSTDSRLGSFQLNLELEVSRISTGIGDESGFRDDDASTRVALPGEETTRESGDEELMLLELGDAELTPVFVNALLHWGNDKADFYAGGGLGVVFASGTESQAYADFVGDAERDDLVVEDAFAVNLKLGSNYRLNESWLLFFEASYFTTSLLGGGPQVRWPGTLQADGVNGVFLGQESFDSDDNGTLDSIRSTDLHIVDPGKFRLDGGSIGLGVRYRFGGGGGGAASE